MLHIFRAVFSIFFLYDTLCLIVFAFLINSLLAVTQIDISYGSVSWNINISYDQLI